MKPWQDYTGDQLRINGLNRGPEWLPILHQALEWFIVLRNCEIQHKLRFGKDTFMCPVDDLIDEFFPHLQYADAQPALQLLVEGNYIAFLGRGEDEPLIMLTATARNHLTYDKQFRENLRDQLMFYLVCGVKIG